MRKGVFLSFEGIDGCGKSTQLRILSERLRASSREVVETVEPGGTEAGRAIRRILLEASHEPLDPRTELLLYFASRAQNVGEVILPALERDAIVLCDRFTDSTLVYQGAGRGLPESTVRDLHRIACGDLWPDVTLLLDIDMETSLSRARARNHETAATETRMDDETASFFEAVRAGYIELARLEPRRIRTIDARATIEEVAESIWAAVQEHV